MKKEEVLELLWVHFEDFMRGQTIGVNEDGSMDYYKWDVETFLSNHFGK